ncbi:MAG: NAD-dependent deacylase [Muribaculaceae bacterium]|nr:NAD-dependent deacylase [Muribaculaceae bacterium]
MKIVFLTGAGISAESGISTFRDSDGLWEQYSIEDVCTDRALLRNPGLVHQFYNARRHDMLRAEPNAAHRHIADLLAQGHDVRVVTQNVDDLHERGGMPADRVLHLHGELTKVRATDNPELLFTLPADGLDTTPDTVISGHRVRPHIVFFGEPVPMLEPAIDIVSQADVLVIVGTSLAVYPAAGLINYARPGARVLYIDPHPAAVPPGVSVIAAKATEGMARLDAELSAM